MKHTIQYSFILLVGVIFLSGCRIIYYPNAINTPIFKEAGELQINAGVGLNGLDLQSAFAPTENFGIMVNGNLGSNKSNQSTSANGYDNSHKYLEAGAGYLNPFSKTGRFELFVGGGGGSITALDHDIFLSQVDGSFSKFFIQPQIGVCGKYIDFAFAMRTSFVNFSSEVVDQAKTKIDAQHSFLEPVFTGRFGSENIKFFTQMGLCLHMGGSNFVNYQPLVLNFGVHFNFGTRRRYWDNNGNEINKPIIPKQPAKSKWD